MPEPVPLGSDFVSEDEDFEYTDEDGNGLVSEDYADVNGILYRLHRALAITEFQLRNDTFQIFNDLLPDNPNFTQDDATDWYRRLGLYNSGNVAFSDMKLAIAQKQSFAITPLNKQNYLFIEQQLRAAGFDVHIYENRFSDGMGGFISKSPEQVLGTPPNGSEYNDSEYGHVQYGGAYSNKIVNYIEEPQDAVFIVANYRTTFFVAGATITTFANIPASRKQEFRQLLLTLKQAQAVGYLFVHYV
jgi:hypothetical protein